MSELAVTFDMSGRQGQSDLSRNTYDNYKETVVEADDVMAAAAAAQQLVQMSGDSEDEVRHRPSTPPAVGSSTASSGRRRVKDDDDEGGEERRCGVKRRKRFRSIRIIYMKTKPMLEPSSANRMRS